MAHTLCGFVIADSAFTDKLGKKTAWWTAAVASNLPDIDIVTLPFVGRDFYMQWHRGLTHSLLACFLVPPIIAFVAARVSKQEFRPLWLLALVCYAAHLAMDVPTVWGTMLLLPFSDTRFSLNWIYIVDLFFIAILTMPYWLGKRVPLPRPAMARFSLGVLAVYILMCGGLHSAAVSEAEAASERQNIEASHVAAYPSPFLPILWNAVVRDDVLMYQAGLRVIGGYDTELVAIGAINSEHPAVRAVLDTHQGRRFAEWWAREPLPTVRCTGKDRLVIFTDYRYRNPWSSFLPKSLRGQGFSLVFHLEAAEKKNTYRVIKQHWLMPADDRNDLPGEACPLQPTRKRRAKRGGGDRGTGN